MRSARHALLVALWSVTVAWAGPLDDYVAKKDKSYGWRIIDEGMVNPAVSYCEMILTSQTWKGMEWHHRVHIYRPKEMGKVHHAFLFIGGGGWDDEKEKQREERLRKQREARQAGQQTEEQAKRKGDFEEVLATQVVMATKMPMAVLSNVPRQPIFDGKHEDEIISYTFDKYLETGDSEWPLLLPMTKSAVRAMDALQELAKKQWSTDLEGFVVAGGSKRGWTTWLTAAADKRVSACAPAVIDVLNMEAQMKYQLQVWGKYSEQIEDYSRRGLQQKFETDAGRKLLRIVDPYFYLDRIKQPKMPIIGTNDRYWPIDALNLYWKDMIGTKYISYIPNKGHAAIDVPRLVGNLSALTLQAAGKLTIPNMTWDLATSDKGVSLKVRADKPAERVWVFIAKSPLRDFREVKWEHEPTAEKDGQYVYELPMPAEGYAAMYGEGLFKVEGKYPVYLCTNVRVIGKGPVATKAAAEGADKAEKK
ncbi:MAG: hypothetical protein JXQ73_10930 [Phycisphaerae bacterium]|nr:hypothetical protein [Phycisphaerae bacterium]